jgi:hypothetical protein
MIPLTIAVHANEDLAEAPAAGGRPSLFTPAGLKGLEASRAKMSSLRMAIIALGCGAVFGSAAGTYIAFTAAPLGQVMATLAPSPAKATRIDARTAPVSAIMAVWSRAAP